MTVIALQMQDQLIIGTIGTIMALHILPLQILPEVRDIQHPQTPILLHVHLIQHLKIPIATLHTLNLQTLPPIVLHIPVLQTLHLIAPRTLVLPTTLLPIALHIPDQVVRQADLLILRQVLVAVPHLHLPVAAVPQEEADNLPRIINH